MDLGQLPVGGAVHGLRGVNGLSLPTPIPSAHAAATGTFVYERQCRRRCDDPRAVGGAPVGDAGQAMPVRRRGERATALRPKPSLQGKRLVPESGHSAWNESHMWIVPAGQSVERILARLSGAVICPASRCGATDRGPCWSSRTGPHQVCALGWRGNPYVNQRSVSGFRPSARDYYYDNIDLVRTSFEFDFGRCSCPGPHVSPGGVGDRPADGCDENCYPGLSDRYSSGQ